MYFRCPDCKSIGRFRPDPLRFATEAAWLKEFRPDRTTDEMVQLVCHACMPRADEDEVTK
jgi:hypothetical protein